MMQRPELQREGEEDASGGPCRTGAGVEPVLGKARACCPLVAALPHFTRSISHSGGLFIQPQTTLDAAEDLLCAQHCSGSGTHARASPQCSSSSVGEMGENTQVMQ